MLPTIPGWPLKCTIQLTTPYKRSDKLHYQLRHHAKKDVVSLRIHTGTWRILSSWQCHPDRTSAFSAPTLSSSMATSTSSAGTLLSPSMLERVHLRGFSRKTPTPQEIQLLSTLAMKSDSRCNSPRLQAKKEKGVE